MEARLETVRDLAHVWVGREALEDGECQYVKRWKNQGMPWAEYWPVREHSLLVRLGEEDIRHVVEVIGIDARYNEVRTRDAGISLDRLDRRVQVRGEAEPYPHPFFDIAELLKLMRWALVALDEIHRVGLVHCDLSAGNICLPLAVSAQGWSHLDYSRLKLIDFAFSLHRNVPLKHPLPVDTMAPDLFFLPPFFRAAIAQDQRESCPAHGQRLMNPGIDLYSLGMISQAWYRAGFRPHERISAAAVEALFRRLGGHGREGPWRAPFQTSGRQLLRTIDRMLDRADTDISRSADFRFLAAESRPVSVQTAVTPLLTRIRHPAEQSCAPERSPERVGSATGSTAHRPGIPTHRPADALASTAGNAHEPVMVAGGAQDAVALWENKLPAPSPRLTAAKAIRGARPILYGALLLLCVAVAGAWYGAGLHPRPSASEARDSQERPQLRTPQVPDPDRLAMTLASPDAGARTESARSLARYARAGQAGLILGDKIARHYIDMLSTSAASPAAGERHRLAWAALSSLAEQAEDLAFAQAAKKAVGDYEGQTEELHRRLGGLIYDRRAQEAEPDWKDYVLHLSTLANAAGARFPRGALMLGLIESGNGREADALRHLLVALLHGDDREEAAEDIARLLQRLIDTRNRQGLKAVLIDVEKMAEQRNPGWQIWAARINDVLGEENKTASWYRRVTENEDAGAAERDFARSEIARLMSRR